jgi:flagellin-like protein
MKKGFKWNRKGVSPVIATIIIVAIAIVMSIAVAYWMLGLGASFTKYEKLEFTTGYATKDAAGDFTIHLTIKNTGSATATIDDTAILYNGIPADGYPTLDQPVPTNLTVTLDPGKGTTGASIAMAGLSGSGTWNSGMTVEVMIHTVAGKDYPKVIMLP